MLQQCWNTQKGFGQKDCSFVDWEGVFQMVLAEYSKEQVEKGLFQHLKTSRERPTPADIVAIINNSAPEDRRKNKLKYVGIMRQIREHKFIDSDTSNWLNSYEKGDIPTVI